MSEQFLIDWIDCNREPKCAPNPKYPDGIDLNVAIGGKPTCTVQLPYPARRCGIYDVVCNLCHMNVACTTAGRADDPRSITMSCKIDGMGKA